MRFYEWPIISSSQQLVSSDATEKKKESAKIEGRKREKEREMKSEI
jgi:hypothetical protein